MHFLTYFLQLFRFLEYRLMFQEVFVPLEMQPFSIKGYKTEVYVRCLSLCHDCYDKEYVDMLICQFLSHQICYSIVCTFDYLDIIVLIKYYILVSYSKTYLIMSSLVMQYSIIQCTCSFYYHFRLSITIHFWLP